MTHQASNANHKQEAPSMKRSADADSMLVFSVLSPEKIDPDGFIEVPKDVQEEMLGHGKSSENARVPVEIALHFFQSRFLKKMAPSRVTKGQIPFLEQYEKDGFQVFRVNEGIEALFCKKTRALYFRSDT